ncbi:MAG: CvpA family protein, partial [Tumebacillaceae bacterium]
MTIGMTDLIIGCFLLLAGFNGWRTGLVRQIVTVVALFLSYFLAKTFTWMVEPYVAKYVSVPTLSSSNPLSLLVNQETNVKLQSGLSFVLLFVFFFFAIKFVGRALDALARMPALSGMNRITGLVVGTVLGFFIAALVC